MEFRVWGIAFRVGFQVIRCLLLCLNMQPCLGRFLFQVFRVKTAGLPLKFGVLAFRV